MSYTSKFYSSSNSTPFSFLLALAFSLAFLPSETNSDTKLGGLYPGAYFDSTRNVPKVLVHSGERAYLPCYVKQLGNKVISWLRKADAHIISVDNYLFIADDRFSIIPSGDSWTLQIRGVTEADAGSYQCQLSTEPKLALDVELSVIVPKIWIDSADNNIHVWEGSQVQIRCIVQNANLIDAVRNIVWTKDGQIINKDGQSNFIVFQTQLKGEATLIESAVFANVHKLDSGNYTCSMRDVGESGPVSLHILSGETAMLHTNRDGEKVISRESTQVSSSSSSSFPTFTFTLMGRMRRLFVHCVLIINVIYLYTFSIFP